ncbi:MAG: hypothetical protein D6696_11960 [Acidobacteria bacterium]|nr:MAG: hypothetical protein D6696_11960 [Acidobacteriota bacterium]
MIVSGGEPFEHLPEILAAIDGWRPLSEDAQALAYVAGYGAELAREGRQGRIDAYGTFLPPRLVAAAREGQLVPFFGAGVSAAANVPTWARLLERLGISPEVMNDPQAQTDPLTVAELLAHEYGNDAFQKNLRDLMRSVETPALVHCLLARLAQPLYVTTNYDQLFELAWQRVFPSAPPPIKITNDADLERHGIDPDRFVAYMDRPVILKIHGCVSRLSEELILTRSQYRRHYRSNAKMFRLLRNVLGSRHTLFLGFGHRDPEVTRQVEDVIHRFESGDLERPPAFYSLQFDMLEKTPEIFAARGIVALHPPLAVDAPRDFDARTAGVCKAMVDLLGAMDAEVHKGLRLDDELEEYCDEISASLKRGMDALAEVAARIPASAGDDAALAAILDALRRRLGPLAGQGIYLLHANGDLRRAALDPRLVGAERRAEAALAERFYFKQAKTYRKAFVSDSDRSRYNRRATFFLCQPVLDGDIFRGLLFAAAQVGSWRTPLDCARRFHRRHPEGSFVLLDSNGIVLLPPNDEFPCERSARHLPAGERPEDNAGYGFDALHRLSRRDKLVEHLWRNIVPLKQDDDVLPLDRGLTLYSVVSDVRHTRWKLALSIPLSVGGLDG